MITLKKTNNDRVISDGLKSWSCHWVAYFADIDAMSDVQLAQLLAVRTDSEVGVGSCTSVDECTTPAELIQLIADLGGAEVAPERAVALVRESEGIYRSVEEDIRNA